MLREIREFRKYRISLKGEDKNMLDKISRRIGNNVNNIERCMYEYVRIYYIIQGLRDVEKNGE